MFKSRAIDKGDRRFAYIAKTFSLLVLCCVAAEPLAQTITQKIGTIQIQPSPEGTHYYFRPAGLGGWGDPGCPSARYIWITPTAPGAKEMYNLGVIAKALDKNVTFQGNCWGADYFQPTYVIVEQ